MSNFDQIYADILSKLPAKVRQGINQTSLRELVCYVQLFEHQTSRSNDEASQLRAILERERARFDRMTARIQELEEQVTQHHEDMFEIGRQLVPQDMGREEEETFEIKVSRKLRTKLYFYARDRLIGEGQAKLSGEAIVADLEAFLRRGLQSFIGRRSDATMHAELGRTIEHQLRELGAPSELRVVVQSVPDNPGKLDVRLDSDLPSKQHDEMIEHLNRRIAGRHR